MSTNLSAKKCSIIIVVSIFNKRVVDNLLSGALRAFTYHGGDDSKILVFKVPGAFEIPGAISQVQKYHNPDAIIGIGAVIKGETPHFDYISTESARGIANLSIKSDIPIINGIITTETAQHAYDRASKTGKNKGWEAMEAALHTISVYKSMQISS